jgi:hypothetical protein
MRCKWCGEELHYEELSGKRILCDSKGGESHGMMPEAEWAMLCTRVPNETNELPFHTLSESSVAQIILSKYADLDADSELDTSANNPVADS